MTTNKEMLETIEAFRGLVHMPFMGAQEDGATMQTAKDEILDNLKLLVQNKHGDKPCRWCVRDTSRYVLYLADQDLEDE